MQNNNTIDMQNESLEDLITGYINKIKSETDYKCADIHLEYAIKHGANWQKEKDKAVIDKLIEALKETNAALNKIIETGQKENNHVNFFLFDSWCNDIHLANEKAKQLLNEIEKETL